MFLKESILKKYIKKIIIEISILKNVLKSTNYISLMLLR